MEKSRRAAFWTILLIATYLSCEIIAGLGLAISRGSLSFLRQLRGQRLEMLGGAGAGSGGAAGRAGTLPAFARTEVLHPYLGFVARPEVDPPAEPGRWTHEFQFVEGRPLLQEKADDEVVIGVLGGSVAGMMVTDYLPALQAGLARLRPLQNKKVSILPMAAGGYKQPQPYFALAYALMLGVRFDYVLNLDGFNDVALPLAENHPNGVFPAYPRGWHYRVADHLLPEMQRLIAQDAHLQEVRRSAARGLEGSFARYSFLANAGWALADGWLTRQMEALSARAIGLRTANRSFARNGPLQTYASAEEVVRESARLWKQGSLQLHGLCQASGIKYHHFLQPNQYDTGSKPLTAREKQVAVRANHPFAPGARAGYPLLRAHGQALRIAGVKFHDLSRIFAASHQDVYIDNCCHLHPAGNAALLQAILAAIAADPP